MNKKLNILIIGASGYLGSNLYTKIGEITGFSVTGTCTNRKLAGLCECNVLNKNDIDKLMKNHYDVIIWTVMNQSQETEISDRGLRYLVSRLDESTRLIYMSTTVGIGENQSEEIQPIERNDDEYLHNYINGKILGESIVRGHENHVIIRPGSIYGYTYNHKKDSRMIMLREKKDKKETFFRADNLYASFIHVDDLVNGIIELMELNFSGLINIAGTNPVSHYSFNRHLAYLMNIEDAFIISESFSKDKYHTLSSELRKRVLKTVIREI